MEALISVILFFWIANKSVFGICEYSIINPINPDDDQLYNVPVINEIQDTTMILILTASKNSIISNDNTQYSFNKPSLLRNNNEFNVTSMVIVAKNTTKPEVVDDSSSKSFTRPSNTPKIDDQVNEMVTENPTTQIANTSVNVLNSLIVLSNVKNNTTSDEPKAKNPASTDTPKKIKNWFSRTKLKLENFFIRIIFMCCTFFIG